MSAAELPPNISFICVFGQKVWAEQTEAGNVRAGGQEGMNFGPSNRKDSPKTHILQNTVTTNKF